MAEPREPGRAVRKPERFEVFESDADSHLTPEQKTWPRGKAEPPVGVPESAGEPVPALEVRLPEATGAAGEDRVEQVVTALETLERLLGGGGFARLGRRPRKPGNEEVVMLYPRAAGGAADRLAKLAGAIGALGIGSARVV